MMLIARTLTHHAINITDSFMRAIERDEMWDLLDPNDGSVRDS